jgi:hypothetical protein
MRYRHACLAAVLCVSVMSIAAAQIAKRRPTSKGPRALGLVEVDAKGRARLVPVTIMIDGRFYDASVYKADPIPMALQPGTVYEGMQSGVSQGLFTVGSAIPASGWLALGMWKSHQQMEAEMSAGKARAAKLSQKPPEDLAAGGPPRLSRSPEGAHSKPGTAPGTSPPQPASDEPPDRPVLKAKPTSSPAPPAAEDADRPVLRRQPVGEIREQTKAEPDTEPLKGQLQLIPAISDADGPQPRPYTYATKPDEDQAFMKKMSQMAGDEVRHRAEQFPATGTRMKSGRLSVTPEFQDAQLRVFDISNTNEAVLVFTASAHLPGSGDLQYRTAVVARQDIYGDLHRIFAHTTDTKHLDVQPEYDFIDAVDADGDGRGELLFRQVWDSGSGFAVYRVIGDRLWPLFESKPGS